MKVSCVIPCHNVEQLVGHALASVLDQDLGAIEVICVDDGSTDGTGRLLDEAAARSGGRITVIHQANKGASAARNAGLARCTGEYVQFLDADDVLLPGKIAGQLALADAQGGPDLVVGDYEQVMPNGLLLRTHALSERPWMALIRTRMGTTSSVIWRRSTLQRLGGWNEELASSQDYELMFRALQAGATVAWDPQVRTQVLKRASGSISQTDTLENWKRYIALRKAIKDHLERTDPAGFAPEIEALRQYIFMALRIVAVTDLSWAIAEYKACIGRGFRPEVSRAITERYVLLHNLLGFAGAERVTRLAKRR